MSLLVTGAGGLVGAAVARQAPEATALDHSALDITDPRAVAAALDRWRPDAVINAAARADVDGADRDPEAAFAVNDRGVGVLARACAERGVRLVHPSTDYVLTGPDRGGRLTEATPPDPRSTYARSKRAGEQRVLAHDGVVVRVQWVYHPGGRGFFTAALRRLAAGRPVRLVTDQAGVPSPADWVADGLLRCARGGPTGLFHLAPDGETTAQGWILTAARHLGLSTDGASAARREDFPGAYRPARSCLDNAAFRAHFGLEPAPWDLLLRGALDRAGRAWLAPPGQPTM